MSDSPEVFKDSTEQLNGIKEAAETQAEALKDRLEKGAEASPEARTEALEKARSDAQKEALMSKERGGAETKRGGEPTATAIRKITKNQKDTEYKKTLAEVQSQMSAPERVFSKVIHNPIVEKVSDVAGSTIARPNAILAGAVTAFIAVTVVYLIAKHYGYLLSGSETIVAFGLGWFFGAAIDYLRLLLTGGANK